MFGGGSDQLETCENKKIYLCRRCLNHGTEIPKRGHSCSYAKCDCSKCILLVERRHLSIKRNHLEIEVDVVNNDDQKDRKYIKNNKRGFNTYCSLCKNHDKHNLFEKGHKRVCKYQNCDCQLCTTTRQYNDVMAQQMKVRRNHP